MNDAQNTHHTTIDILTIEAEARRMRAKFLADGVAALSRRIAALFSGAGQRAQG